MRFSSGKRSSELLPAIWSNTPRVVLGSRYGKPLEAANRQSCLALTSRTGLCRGRSLGDQVEGAVGDTFRDRSQGVIVVARMGLKHEERLIHRPDWESAPLACSMTTRLSSAPCNCSVTT